MDNSTKDKRIQVKVCGLTRADQAVACAKAGADAIGCVFFNRSPRNVSESQALEIRQALPERVALVGVFVDEPFSVIMNKIQKCHLDAVQLHGTESPQLVARLMAENISVIKGLFQKRAPLFSSATDYAPTAFLLECGKGKLPGGNAETWEWEAARAVDRARPLVLAGGLTPENVEAAISDALPDAVDVSSGVEKSPGIKDLDKVTAFMAAVARAQAAVGLRPRSVFITKAPTGHASTQA